MTQELFNKAVLGVINQEAHDSADTLYDFIQRARIVAVDHRLIMPV